MNILAIIPSIIGNVSGNVYSRNQKLEKPETRDNYLLIFEKPE